MPSTTDTTSIPVRTGVEVWSAPDGEVSVALGQIVRVVTPLRSEQSAGDADLRRGLGRLDLLAAPCRECGHVHETWAELGGAARRVSAHTRSLISEASAARTNSADLATHLQEQLGDLVASRVDVTVGIEGASVGDVLFVEVDEDSPLPPLPEETLVVMFRASDEAIVCAAPTALRAAPCTDCVGAGLRGLTGASRISRDARAPLVAAAVVTMLQRLELGAVANGSALRLDLATGLLEHEVLRARLDCRRCRGADEGSPFPALAYEERIASPYAFDVDGLLSPPLPSTEDAPPSSPQRPRIRVKGGAVEDSPVYPSSVRPAALEGLVAIVGDLFGEAGGVHRGVPSAGGLRATRCYVASVVDGLCHTFAFEGREGRSGLAQVRTPFVLDAPDGVALIAVTDIDALLPKYAGNAPRLAALELGMCLALLQEAVGASHTGIRFEGLGRWEDAVAALPRRRLSAAVFVASDAGGEHA